MAEGGVAKNFDQEDFNFEVWNSWRHCVIVDTGLQTENRFYVNPEFFRQWSEKFNKLYEILTVTQPKLNENQPKITENQRKFNENLTKINEIRLDLNLLPEEHKLFLQVIHGQKNVKSLRELLMLMKAADRLECLPMQQAICVVTILKLQQILRDCEQEDRRRLLPYVYKILSHYNGPPMPGMYPQVLSLCTRNDIEMMILQPRDEFGKNSDLVWEMLSHYIRMPQPGQIRALELQSQYWRTSSLPNLIPPTAAEFTPELVENHALNFDLHLADTKLKVNLPTLMSVSPIFRTMIDWESQPGQAFPTNKDGLPVVFLSLPEDNLGSTEEVNCGLRLSRMLTPTVYGCIWRLLQLEEFTQKQYLDGIGLETLVHLFRFADKFNITGLLCFFAEGLMTNEQMTLMEKLVIADGCYRAEFLDMCFQDPVALSQLVKDFGADRAYGTLSEKTKEKITQRLADFVILQNRAASNSTSRNNVSGLGGVGRGHPIVRTSQRQQSVRMRIVISSDSSGDETGT